MGGDIKVPNFSNMLSSLLEVHIISFVCLRRQFSRHCILRFNLMHGLGLTIFRLEPVLGIYGSSDPVQTPQNAASELGQNCFYAK